MNVCPSSGWSLRETNPSMMEKDRNVEARGLTRA